MKNNRNPHPYRNHPQAGLLGMQPLLIDNFAGGGGASTGIELALIRDVDIAINHDKIALSVHTINHPHTRHYCESVWDVDPLKVTRGHPVGLAWFSPDCTHFSRAKGGKPVRKDIRGLARVAVRWAARVKPGIIMMENVPEFRGWCPIRNGKPIAELSGINFEILIKQFRHLGYQVEWRVLEAHHYGAPTIRKRLFLIARNDGQPINWPRPSHTPKGRRGKNYRTAAECIDWSIPCPSIFERPKPLAENTCKRVAKGIMKFVVNSKNPFVVDGIRTPFVSRQFGNSVGHSAEQPLRAITAGGLGKSQLVAPIITKLRNGNTASGIDESLHTITSGGTHHALTCAFLAKHYTGVTGSKLNTPLGTATAKDHHSLVSACMIPIDNTGGAHIPAHDVDEPLRTITKENRHAVVHAFLIKYYGAAIGQDINEPLHAVTSKHRFGLVTIKGEDYQIIDIGLRMLQPHELYRAQGFPDDYIIDRDAAGNSITKTKQVALCGNSVPPPVVSALVDANVPESMRLQKTGIAA